ncbi:hypothetical protein EKD04_007270 [Chloroflexales bacterium ZM16-3]|nr:hypothetical protein [Chloroflexales bacterium ZM16-3]
MEYASLLNRLHNPRLTHHALADNTDNADNSTGPCSAGADTSEGTTAETTVETSTDTVYTQAELDLETLALRDKQRAALHEALTPYLDTDALRQLVASSGNLYDALRRDNPPADVQALLDLLKTILTPHERYQIRSPADVAALLMVDMGHLDQEELRVIMLDNKNRVQEIATIYRGSVNTIQIRVGEIYKAAVRWNSTAIVVVHNHPSGDITPSPEDILVTRKIVEAGDLLDVQCVDHLIIGHGRWCSMRERGLGFTKGF